MQNLLILFYQRVQKALIPGLSSLVILAELLANHTKNRITIGREEILQYVIDSLVLVSQGNWRLNKKRREQIKLDNVSPYSSKVIWHRKTSDIVPVFIA